MYTGREVLSPYQPTPEVIVCQQSSGTVPLLGNDSLGEEILITKEALSGHTTPGFHEISDDVPVDPDREPAGIFT